MKYWDNDIDIPDGYVKLEYGEPMKPDDLIWKWDEAMTHERWELLGDCEESRIEFPYNISYRPMVRKDD